MKRLLMLAVAGVLLAGAPAFAADAVHGRHSTGPGCHDAHVIKRIGKIFAHRMKHVYHSDLEIVTVNRIHQRRYEPKTEWSRPIARRYCGATAKLSDGRKRSMWFLIEERMGFASLGDNVEVCVSGFTRWKEYGGRCRALW